MSLRPGVLALAHALKQALELPSDAIGQITLNYSPTCQSIETRTFLKVEKGAVDTREKCAQS
jgi:hypothetical protein